ncbi:MAG: hypothetical protein DWH81_06815 [Planctomycetota bacterium]|nr:MAG: hypothetical protein DWH81_06815 [Planctomycetota bacterium]
MNWLKHAFDTSGPDEPPSAAQLELADKLCHEVVRRGLAIPALVFLEMSRPLNRLSSQAIHFLAPMLGMFRLDANRKDDSASDNPAETSPEKPDATHEILAQFLERPDSVEYLCQRIDAMEKARTHLE